MSIFGRIYPNHSLSLQKIKFQLLSIFKPLQLWIDRLEIRERRLAHRIVRLIPAQCPFAREVKVFNRVIFRIPALCKLNPLYEQLTALRFRALCFLADHCQEDITPYCV